MGVVDSLHSITDHPKINADPVEYARINKDLQYFKGTFPKVKSRNTYGDDFKRDYVSLNMLQVVCRRLASLIYNEQSKITVETRPTKIGDDGEAETYEQPDEADTFVQKVLQANDFNKNFERYLESCLALGGLAIRPYVDPATKQIKLTWAQAPSFYPLDSNSNDISSAAIATPSTRTENGKPVYYTLLEFHEWKPSGYTITNELYRSKDRENVGYKVALKTLYPDLAEIANLDTAIFTRPLFVYLKPAGFNNRNLTSPLGVGIADNARPTLKQINDTYDQFNWEIRMGQRRVAVPESMVEVQYDERQKQPEKLFDPDQNVFLAVQNGMDGTGVTDLTSPIRSGDYIASLNQFLKTLEMQVGLSAGTFTFDGVEGVKTATEVVSENSRTYQTRNSEITMVERAVQELVVSICELASGTVIDGAAMYSGPIPTIDQVTVDFDDGIFTDKGANADYWIKLDQAGLVEKWRAIGRVLDVPDDEAKRIAQAIADEAVPDMPTQQSGMFGGDDDGAGQSDNQDSKQGDGSGTGGSKS